MTKIRLKYLHCFNDRHGKPHCYFRYRGQQWPLPAPATEGFATAYDALLAHIKANPLAIQHNVEFMPSSLGWAIEKFLSSPMFNVKALRDLEPRYVGKIRNEIAATSSSAG